MQIDFSSARVWTDRSHGTMGLPFASSPDWVATIGGGESVGSLQPEPPPVHRNVTDPFTEVSLTSSPPQVLVPVMLRSLLAVTSKVPPAPPKPAPKGTSTVLEAISSDEADT